MKVKVIKTEIKMKAQSSLSSYQAWKKLSEHKPMLKKRLMKSPKYGSLEYYMDKIK